MSCDADSPDVLFNAQERALIVRALSGTADAKDAEEDQMTRIRLRNLLEKYRELAKRERFRDPKNNDSALRVKRLESILGKLNPP